MAAARSFDDKLARIRGLDGAPAHEARAYLKKLLADRNGFLVGEAAEAVKRLEMRELAPDLAEAFLRLLSEPAKADPGCRAKLQIVDVLMTFDAHEPDAYLAGLRHVQIEGSYPKPIDTAPPLRGLCAHALFQMRHPAAIMEAAPMLFDRYPVARAEAASAIANEGTNGAAAVLHVKALSGDLEADVLCAVYKGLLRIAAERYLPLVTAALLKGQEHEVEAAALALGESRAQGAFQSLRSGWEEHRQGRAAEGILLAIALLRSDEANGWLVALVEDAPEDAAAAAVSALALHRHDAALVAKVKAAVEGRGSRKLSATLADRFRT